MGRYLRPAEERDGPLAGQPAGSDRTDARHGTRRCRQRLHHLADRDDEQFRRFALESLRRHAGEVSADSPFEPEQTELSTVLVPQSP
jgi:hypothetical protein